MTHDRICGAIPKGGDGSLWCICVAMHRGPHIGQGNEIFRAIQPGTSARSQRSRPKQRAIIRAVVEGQRVGRRGE